MKKENISDAVIRRLPRYYRQLTDLCNRGVIRISSHSLGQEMNITASQIRQDFSCFGEFGQQGYGYNVEELRAEIGHILGVDNDHHLIMIGVGNLGHALLQNFDFDKVGFSLITIRNGCRTQPEKYPKVYAEKLLYLKEGQMAANHFHWYKTEDIINRGGGNVLIRVYNSLPDESIDKVSDVTVHCDGKAYTVPAGTQIRLTPGESIHIPQYLYHDFNVEPGSGPVLLGEVSQCNDDNTDNRFNPPVGRFPKIEEDEPPYRLLCNEYPAAKD